MDVVWFLKYGKIVRTKLINAFISEFRISTYNKTSSLIVSGIVSHRHKIEREHLKAEYPIFTRSEKNILYILLRKTAKIEYYLMKLIYFIRYYFITNV